MRKELDWAELGNEYANLLIAVEYGIDREGNPVEWEPGRQTRMNAIDDLFGEHKNYTLNDYVENALQELGL